ncbi:hypothetical protein [Halosimplex amylolyticum]|uniref:hypothetical protein n=1 Tax=Halosimplex amylolyticum TaxID=3396616 RepID=UPI003F548156
MNPRKNQSSGAYLADLAAATLLADRSGHWIAIGPDQRMQVLAALRLWLDDCPQCGGRVEIGRDTIESCCRSVDVVASTCQRCGDRLFEAEGDPVTSA